MVGYWLDGDHPTNISGWTHPTKDMDKSLSRLLIHIEIISAKIYFNIFIYNSFIDFN